MDGEFDYEQYFWTIHDLFDDQDFADEIIGWWNKVVFGSSKARTVARAATSGPSDLAQIKAAHAAQKAAAAAAAAVAPA